MRSRVACALSLALASCLVATGIAWRDASGSGALTLAELMTRMASTAGVVARFREVKDLKLLVVPLVTRGTLYFIPPDRLARFTSEPGFSALVIDGSVLRYHDDPQGEAVDLSQSPMARAFVENFIVLFNGDREGLERVYRADLTSGEAGWELRLTPRRAPLDRLIEVITMRGDDGGLREMVLQESDGDRTTTTFVAVDANRAFDPEEIDRLFSSGLPLRDDGP